MCYVLQKVSFVFLLGIASFLPNVLSAQQDAGFEPENVLYWIGEGQNEAVFIVNWNNPDTALAWGYRFEGETVVVKDMMESIAAADERFDFEANGGMVSDIHFQNGTLDLSLSGSYWLYNVNGSMAANYFDVQTVGAGDYVKWGDESCATDLGDWNYVWTKEVAPVSVYAVDATIAASEILYWVGEGQNEVVFIVNWNNPETALAWGFRFNKQSVTVKEIMDAIVLEDNRFCYEETSGFVEDIRFVQDGMSYSLYGMFWLVGVNGNLAAEGFATQLVSDGDYVKWGDESCGTDLGNWSYVWTTTVTPVSPNTTLLVENKQVEMDLYPNPAVSECQLSISAKNENVSVNISDVQGRTLQSFNTFIADNEKLSISLQDLRSGVYFVSVGSSYGKKVQKLVVR
jgi:hypothetical protein